MNFNIKKIVLGLLGILLISYGIAGCIFLTQYKSNYFVKKTSNYNTSKTLNTDGIKKIYVDTSESSINVTTDNENTAKVNVNGTLSTTNKNNKPELNCYKQGDTLYIEFKRKNNMSFTLFNSSDINMNISIPKSYNNDLSVYCSYGKINMDNLNVKNLTCSSSAGKVTGDNITCNTSYIDSSAGDIELTNFSGDISSKNSAGKTIIQYAKFNNNINLQNSAGTIKLTLPKDSKFNLDAYTTAGDIDCDFPITVTGTNHERSVGQVGESNNTVKIRNTAGNIEINK